jgi:AcrR family transcriptional regulator
MAASSKREQLIETALELFSKHGFHAVGIDTILAKAGIAKRTLYNHFKSKDELILAVLRYRDERFRNDLMRSVEAKTEKPIGRLLAVFDVMGELFDKDNFSGCLFVSAMGEFPEEGIPIRNICQESKLLMQRYIKSLAEKAQLKEADQLSEQFILLLEGAITMAQVNNSSLCAVQAKKAAQVLIENSLATAKQNV